MSPDISNFIVDTNQAIQDKEAGIVGRGVDVSGNDKIEWSLVSVKREDIKLLPICYHVTSLTCRLVCLQQLENMLDSKTNPLTNVARIGGGRTTKVGYQDKIFELPYDPGTNLLSNKTGIVALKYCDFISCHSKDNINLSNTQKILLKTLKRYSHRSIK